MYLGGFSLGPPLVRELPHCNRSLAAAFVRRFPGSNLIPPRILQDRPDCFSSKAGIVCQSSAIELHRAHLLRLTDEKRVRTPRVSKRTHQRLQPFPKTRCAPGRLKTPGVKPCKQFARSLSRAATERVLEPSLKVTHCRCVSFPARKCFSSGFACGGPECDWYERLLTPPSGNRLQICLQGTASLTTTGT